MVVLVMYARFVRCQAMRQNQASPRPSFSFVHCCQRVCEESGSPFERYILILFVVVVVVVAVGFFFFFFFFLLFFLGGGGGGGELAAAVFTFIVLALPES